MTTAHSGAGADADPPVVDVRGLHRFYRRGEEEIAALRDVWLAVPAGEMLAVVGPSGSGKTTLLSLMAGLDDPDGGSVLIGGERMSHRGPARQARLRGGLVGVMTQTNSLLEHLSVLGNVRLAASLRRSGGGRAGGGRWPASGPRPSPEQLLADLGLAHRRRARPSALSGGEVARANLAVALVGAPVVLLADEPTAEVSRPEEAGILALLRAVRPGRAATILVTHSRAVAAAADRVIELVDGKIR